MAEPAAVLSILVTANNKQATAALAATDAQLKKTAATARATAASTAASWTAAGTKMKAAGAAMTKFVTLPAVAVGAAATKMAFDFEESMTKIRTLVGASEHQVEQWSEALLKMGPKLGKSPKELADALYFVTSSGVKASDALGVVKEAAMASSQGLGETQIVADAVTSAMNAYRKSNLSAADATDVLLQTVKYGKGEPEELAQAIGRVIPVASKLDVGFNDVGASLAGLTLQGLDAAEATTALRAVFTTTLKPSADAEKALESVDLSAAGLRRTLKEEGTLAMLNELTEAFKGDEEQIARVFPNVRALVGAFNLTGDSAGRNAKIWDNMSEQVDVNRKGFEKWSETAAGRMKLALASLQSALTELGLVLLPIVADFAEGFATALEDVADWFEHLDPNIQKVIVALGLLAVVAGPILITLGAIALAIGAISAPMLVVAGGIAALVAAFAAGYATSEDFREAIAEIGSTFEEIGADLEDFSKSWVVGETLEFAYRVVQRILPAIAQQFKGFAHVVQGVVEVITGILTLDFAKAWEGLKHIFGGLFDMIVGNLRMVTAPVREVIATIAGVIGDGLAEVADLPVIKQLVDAFEWAFNAIRDATKWVANALWDIGKTIGPIIAKVLIAMNPMVKIFHVLKAVVGAAINFIVDHWEQISWVIKNSLVGHFVRLIGKAFRWLKGVAGDVIGWLGDRWKDLQEVISKVPIDDAIHKIGDAWRDARDTTLNAVSDILGGISSVLSAMSDAAAVGGPFNPFSGLEGPAQDAADAIDDARASIDAFTNSAGKNRDGLNDAKNEIRHFGNEAKQGGKKAGEGLKGGVKDGVDKTQKELGKLPGSTKKTLDKTEKTGRKGSQEVGNAVGKPILNAVDAVTGKDGIGTLFDSVNEALGQFESKDKVTYKPMSTKEIEALHGQKGAIVPGIGSGDKVPLHVDGKHVATVEPGEYVGILNRNAAQRMMEFNAAVPRFQSGGSLNPAIADLAGRITDQFGGSYSGTRPGDDGFHGSGDAIDWSNGDWQGASKWANQIGPQLAEGIYNPTMFPGIPVSWDSGNQVSPGFWGTGTWADHQDHIHLAILQALSGEGAQGSFGAAAAKIKEVLLSGPDGPVKSMAQGALDMVHKAAQAYTDKHGGGVAGGSVPIGPVQEMARQLTIQRWNAGQWPPMDELIKRESNYDMDVFNTAGSGAYGIAQALPASKYPPAGQPSAPNSPEKARAQLQWMVGYIAERYGSPSGALSFHDANNWYQRGGVLGLNGGGKIDLSKADNWQMIQDLPGAKQAKKLFKRVAKGKSIRDLMKKLQGLGPEGLTDEVDGLTVDFDKFIEYADNASANVLTDDDGNIISDPGFGGKGEKAWVEDAFAALWKIRDHILALTEKVAQAKKVIDAAVDRAHDRIKDLEKHKREIQKELGKVKGNGDVAKQTRKNLHEQVNAINKQVTTLKDKVIPPLQEKRDLLGDDKTTVSDALEFVQGSIINETPGLHLPPQETVTQFSGELFNTAQRLIELGSTATPSATGVSDAALASADDWRKRYVVSQSQYGVFRNFFGNAAMGAAGYMGAFQAGGVALVGERGAELAHLPSGTRIHSAEDTQSMLNPNVYVLVEDGAVDQSRIRGVSKQEYDMRSRRSASWARRSIGRG